MPWDPQPGPQTSALLADWVDELFFGGERGGGKSDFQLGYQEDGALRYSKAWRGIMFRKTYAELEELQARAVEIFSASGGVFKTQPSADYPFSNCWYWPNGASVKMRYIEREQDYGRYHGHQYTGISADEVTEYASPRGILKMLSTLRSPEGVPCSIRLTGNPGGIGHAWVKSRYIDVAPPYTPYTDPDSGLARMFIPSKTADNVIMLTRDPNYRQRILASTGGNEVLRKAWLEGSWDIVAGAFFTEWSRERHVIPTAELPESWPRIIGFDWGSARPFSVHWGAVVTDEGTAFPRGAIILYREWYGMQEGQENVGLKLTAEEIAEGIAERSTLKEHMSNKNVAGLDLFKEDGGPSLSERMYRHRKVTFGPADVSRLAGWDQYRARLRGEDGRPMLYVMDCCRHLIRTLPMAQHDELKPEDIDTDGEDHGLDSSRYLIMSRPYVPPLPKDRFAGKPRAGSFDWLLDVTSDKTKRVIRV